MLNYIWAFMILTGIIYALCTGQMGTVTNGALDSAGEAVSLCITMAGVVALWMGLMEIAKQAGLIDRLTKRISPFLDFMFPRIPKNHPARGYIAANLIANVLGLGWACTPAGLKAMEELAKLEEEREAEREMKHTAGHDAKYTGESPLRSIPWTPEREHRAASNEMCNFLILNISSLQLVSVNMIAYRSQYGSGNPTSVIGPSIFATLCSTLAAIVYCKIKDRRKR